MVALAELSLELKLSTFIPNDTSTVPLGSTSVAERVPSVKTISLESPITSVEITPLV